MLSSNPQHQRWRGSLATRHIWTSFQIVTNRLEGIPYPITTIRTSVIFFFLYGNGATEGTDESDGRVAQKPLGSDKT